MFVLEQILCIVLILYIDFLMPMSCQAALETNEVWMKSDEDANNTFTLKPIRRLLDWKYDDHSSSSKSTAVIVALIGFLITLIALLIRCCIWLARRYAYEETSERVVHPPPRTHHFAGTYSAPPHNYRGTSTTASRPLAPPRTRSTLILIPDGASNDGALLGIENPSYISTTVTFGPANARQERRPVQSQQQWPERKNSNPTPLLDLPPAYDSVFNSNEPSTNLKPPDSDKDALPKYSDVLSQPD